MSYIFNVGRIISKLEMPKSMKVKFHLKYFEQSIDFLGIYWQLLLIPFLLYLPLILYGHIKYGLLLNIVVGLLATAWNIARFRIFHQLLGGQKFSFKHIIFTIFSYARKIIGVYLGIWVISILFFLILALFYLALVAYKANGNYISATNQIQRDTANTIDYLSAYNVLFWLLLIIWTLFNVCLELGIIFITIYRVRPNQIVKTIKAFLWQNTDLILALFLWSAVWHACWSLEEYLIGFQLSAETIHNPSTEIYLMGKSLLSKYWYLISDVFLLIYVVDEKDKLILSKGSNINPSIIIT